MLLYYVRHGDPIYEPDSLTPLGKRQAEAVAKRLATHGIDEIYSSTSNRAVMTATPLSEIVKKPITKLDWANEGHVWREFTVPYEDGRRIWFFADKDTSLFFNTEEIKNMQNEWANHPRFDDKTRSGVERVNREVDAFLAQFGYIHNRKTGTYHTESPCKKRIAFFAHQGFSMSFMSSVLDIPYPMYCTHFDMEHTGVTVIHFPENEGEDVIPKVLTLSNDSHIYKENLPTAYNNGFYI